MANENILKHPDFDNIASQFEESRGLPQGTLRAVAYQESRGNSNALSPVGAKGAFQFMDETAKKYNVDVTNPWDSMRGAADYLGDNMKRYGKIEAALADYNGGPNQANALLKTGKPFAKETQGYVTNIMSKINPDAPDERTKNIAGLKVFQAKQQGLSDEDIVSGLIQTAPPSIANVVKRNISSGVSPADIVKGMASKQIEDDRKFKEESDPTRNMSTTQKLLAGAGKSFVDTATGAQQLWARGKSLVTGDDSEVKALQNKVEETDRLDAPLMNTGAGKVGYVGGALAPTVATLGAGAMVNGARVAGAVAPSLTRQVLVNPNTYKTAAANGALNGALTPTSTDEAGVANTALGAVIGASTFGLGKGIAKVISPTSGAKAAQVGENLAAADAHGLNVTTSQLANHGASVTPELAQEQTLLLNALRNRTADAGADALQANTKKLNDALFNRAGATGAQTISEALDQSKTAVRNAYSKVFDGAEIPLNKTTLNQKLDELITSNRSMMEDSKVNQLVKLKDEINRIAPSTAPTQALDAAGKPVGAIPHDIANVSGDTADQFIKRLNGVVSDNKQGNQGFATAVREFRDEVQKQMEAGLGANRYADLSTAKDLWNSKRLLQAMSDRANGAGQVLPELANRELHKTQFRGVNPLADIIKDGKKVADDQLVKNVMKKVEIEALAKALYGKSGNPKASSGLQNLLVGGAVGGLGGNYAADEGTAGAIGAALLTKGGRHIATNDLRDALMASPHSKAAQYYLGQLAGQKTALNALNASSPVILSLSQALAKANKQK